MHVCMYKASSPAMDALMPPSSDEAQRVTLSLTQRNNFWSLRLPLLGRLRLVKDTSGLIQASIVVLYWLYGNWSTWSAVLLPYYTDGVLSSAFLLSKAISPAVIHCCQ